MGADDPGPTKRRVLTFSSLYPSVARPRHGVFVETRLLNLIRDCPVDSRVIAPVPWFPLSGERFGRYGQFAATPRSASRNSLAVTHPRYLMLPKLGVAFQPDTMARAALGDIALLRRAGWAPEIIDSHYLYPDGVAAAIVARELGVPFVMTARGTDVNVLARLPGPGPRILWAARQAAAVITVSSRLADALRECGVEASKLIVLRNGVDLEVFRPVDPLQARLRLELPAGPIAACVGNLVEEKGQALAVEMLVKQTELNLVIVGDGPLRAELAALSRRLSVDARVRFLPNMAQRDLAHLYSGVDVLLLTSVREGWPNVVLEALACGTPVVAFDVGAVREMLTEPWVGRIVARRNPEALAQGVAELLQAPTDRERVRRHAAGFDWKSVSLGQWAVFDRALAGK
jgi:teichuronic acid biosynthesis glycosyltransferase TuaC